MAKPKIVAVGIGSHFFGIRTFKDSFHEPGLAGIEFWPADIDRKRLDTMVGSMDEAERIVADMLKAHRRLLPQFCRKRAKKTRN